MAKTDVPAAPSSNRKSDLLKKLSAGKVLCSEVNKASNNAKFLHMRRHDAFVSQLESAKHSMLLENGRAQKDMRRQLDVYKRRKRLIFRDRVMSHEDCSEDDNEEWEPWSQPSEPSAKSKTHSSSRTGRRKSSSYSVSLLPPSGSSNSSGLFPAILRVPMVASDDENIHCAIKRQFQQHMHRQESLHAQILRSRVHDFCTDLESARSSRVHGFYITSSPARRIVFSEGTEPASPHGQLSLSAKARRTVDSPVLLKGNLKTALPSLA